MHAIRASQSMALWLLLSKAVAVFVESSGWHEEGTLAIGSGYYCYVNDNVLSMKPHSLFSPKVECLAARSKLRLEKLRGDERALRWRSRGLRQTSG